MMRKTTLLATIAATLTALALTGGCGKKKDKDAAGKTPPTTTPTPTPTPTPAPKPAEPPPPPPKPVTLVGKDLAQRFIDCQAAWSASDKAKFTDCYAKDATSRFVDSMAPETKGPAAIVDNAMAFHAGFPDGKNEPQLVLVNGRNVASVVWFHGTNTGALNMGPGMPATGKPVGFNLLLMQTFDDANQVTEEWWVMDDGTFGGQLGINPKEAPPGRPVATKGMDGAPIIVVATDSDVEKNNAAAFQKANDTFNGHDVKAIMADFAPDAIEADQAAPADTAGTKAIEANTKMFLGAFPDGKITTLKAWAAGDYVVGVQTFNGTNTGNMGSMKKTGKPVSLTMGEIVKLDAGKVKQVWRFYNSFAMAMQLGMVKMPDMGGAAGSAPGSAAGSSAGSAPGSAAH